jgi:hypothetical protein
VIGNIFCEKREKRDTLRRIEEKNQKAWAENRIFEADAPHGVYDDGDEQGEKKRAEVFRNNGVSVCK